MQFQSCILLRYAVGCTADSRSASSSERVKASGKTLKVAGQLCKWQLIQYNSDVQKDILGVSLNLKEKLQQ